MCSAAGAQDALQLCDDMLPRHCAFVATTNAPSFGSSCNFSQVRRWPKPTMLDWPWRTFNVHAIACIKGFCHLLRPAVGVWDAALAVPTTPCIANKSKAVRYASCRAMLEAAVSQLPVADTLDAWLQQGWEGGAHEDSGALKGWLPLEPKLALHDSPGQPHLLLQPVTVLRHLEVGGWRQNVLVPVEAEVRNAPWALCRQHREQMHYAHMDKQRNVAWQPAEPAERNGKEQQWQQQRHVTAAERENRVTNSAMRMVCRLSPAFAGILKYRPWHLLAVDQMFRVLDLGR